MVEFKNQFYHQLIMSLNIKNSKAHELAAALAEVTGESMTKAVTVALEERLQRVKLKRRPDALATDLLRIGARCAAAIKGKRTAHEELLYDEYGLPK